MRLAEKMADIDYSEANNEWGGGSDSDPADTERVLCFYVCFLDVFLLKFKNMFYAFLFAS